MKKTLWMAVALALSAAQAARAHENCPPPSASRELDLVKKLAGTWTGRISEGGMADEKDKPVTTQFRVTSGGSAVEEVLMPGTPHEMVDMYHDESGKLAVTHYCAMGNQPHMILRKGLKHSLAFEMGPTPGIDAGRDAHMHALTLEFPDANHLVERWTSYKDGKAGETVVFKLTRS